MSDLRALIDLFGDDGPTNTRSVEILPGMAVNFKVFRSYSESKAARRAAEEEAAKWPIEGSELCKVEPYDKWPYFPSSKEDAVMAMWFKQCIADELPDSEFIRMTKRPSLCHILNQKIEEVNNGYLHVLVGFAEKVEREKKESKSVNPPTSNDS